MNEGKEERAERDKLSEFGGKKIAYHCYLLVKTCASPSPCLLLNFFSWLSGGSCHRNRK